MREHFIASHRRPSGARAFGCKLLLPCFDRLGRSAARKWLEHKRAGSPEQLWSGRSFPPLLRPVARAPVEPAIDPGHLALLEFFPCCPQHDAGPLAADLTQARLYGVGDDINQAIEEGGIVEHWLGGVAPLEGHTAPLPDSIDGSCEVAKEIAGPAGELAPRIAYEKMEMIGHRAERMDLEVGVLLLRPSQPLEYRLVEGGFRTQEEARLVAAGGDQVVGARRVASKRSAHGVFY